MADVTNYFPNPAATTLATATRPKHMGRYYFGAQTPEVTQASLDGGFVVRASATAAGIGNGMLLATDGSSNAMTSFGLEADTGYILSVDIIAPEEPQPATEITIEGWGWNYFWYEPGADAQPAPGERVRLHLPFFIPAEAEAYDLSIMPVFDAAGYVYLDNISICKATMYLDGMSFAQTANGTIDLSALGVTGGGKYLLHLQHDALTAGQFAKVSVVAGSSAGTAVEIHSRETTTASYWMTESEFTVPSGASYVAVVLTGTNTGSNVWNVTVTDAAPEYFDGDTTAGDGYTYAWAGTPHDSYSVRSDGPAGPTGPTAQVHTGGTAKAVAEMRVATAGGILVPVTQAGD